MSYGKYKYSQTLVQLWRVLKYNDATAFVLQYCEGVRFLSETLGATA